MKIKLHCNSCDGANKTYNVHFTSACDNKCAHCVDKVFEGFGLVKPEAKKIAESVLANKHSIEDVLFLGGEPCLFLDELLECVGLIKEQSDLKCYVTTSAPLTCYKNKDKFFRLIELCDAVNISVQHWNEAMADQIRGTISKYDRQAFYKELPNKHKVAINVNLVRGVLDTKNDVLNTIHAYDQGFEWIKFIELQHEPQRYVSMEKILGLNLGSAYACGCQTKLTADLVPELADVKTPVVLRRSCFLTEPSVKATAKDLLKTLHHFFFTPQLAFRVVYEDGRICGGWA